jgi:hypothetical protein
VVSFWRELPLDLLWRLSSEQVGRDEEKELLWRALNVRACTNKTSTSSHAFERTDPMLHELCTDFCKANNRSFSILHDFNLVHLRVF